MPALQRIADSLDLVRTNHKKPSDHNITKVDLPSFTRALVAVARHSTRIVAGVGLLHHPPLEIREPDLKETWELARARASCLDATFELNQSPSLKAVKWPPYPETELMNIQPRSRKIRGKRKQKGLSRVLKVMGPRYCKKRPPARFSASYPPVSHTYLLTRPDTYRGWLYFSKIPDILNEKREKAVRWRHFAVLVGLPHFPRPSMGRFFRRYFRWVISS